MHCTVTNTALSYGIAWSAELMLGVAEIHPHEVPSVATMAVSHLAPVPSPSPTGLSPVPGARLPINITLSSYVPVTFFPLKLKMKKGQAFPHSCLSLSPLPPLLNTLSLPGSPEVLPHSSSGRALLPFSLSFFPSRTRSFSFRLFSAHKHAWLSY